jgi:tetratricopeptide (TPR) repeat protein
LVNRGELQTKSGNYRRGRVCFWLALKFTPGDVGTWSRSFMARMAIGDFRGALRDIDVALALSPHDLNLVVQHAEAAEALEMWAAAVADYEVVMRARADRPAMRAKQAGVYAAWGDGLARAGQLDRALERYTTALQIKPNDIDVLARCVNVKIGLGDGAGALADLDRALALAPHEANLLAQRTSLTEALKLLGADAR